MPFLQLVTKPSFSEELNNLLFVNLNKQAVSNKHLKPIEPWSIELKDETSLKGSATGFILYGALYTDMLFVEKDLWGLGYGTKIMHLAESLGSQRGCSFALVNTFDFEALEFYKKIGYYIEFTREGFDKGCKMYMLRKHL